MNFRVNEKALALAEKSMYILAIMIAIDREHVNELLKRKQGDRSLRSFAVQIGVSAAYLSDIYRGNREPGPKILKLLKVRKIKTISYRYERAA